MKIHILQHHQTYLLLILPELNNLVCHINLKKSIINDNKKTTKKCRKEIGNRSSEWEYLVSAKM